MRAELFSAAASSRFMTINGAALFAGSKTVRHVTLVIIAFAALGANPSAGAGSLTTTAAPLTTVVVDGSTAYGPAQLFAVYRDNLGQPLSREGARAISTAISTALAGRYTADGFVKPEVRVDDSQVARGILRLQVFEAQVTNVVIEGEVGRQRPALERIAAKLEGTRPLRQDDVPQTLRSMRAISGLSVNASTRRDANTRNAFELVVKTDFSPVDGVVRMNNRGTDQVGPHFLLGQVFVNGVFGGQDKLGLIFASATDPDEYLGGGLYFDTPIGDAGTRASSLLFRSDSAPNEAPVNFDADYARERATFKLTHPLRQSSALTLSLTGGVEADDLSIARDGAIIREDRLRIAETGLRATWRGSHSIQYSANLLVRKGFDSFGGGLQAADLANDPRRADFLVTQLQSTIYRRFAENWALRFDGFAQHSGYVLPDGERFKIGGDRLGRGFEVAEIAGDRGIGGKIDLRRELVNTESLFGRVSAYGFYDFGAAWKQDRPGRESATTAGTGLSLAGASLTGYLEIAAPLTGTDVEGKRQTSVFAEISYRF
jgi:hemolysin activation/secretion protein